LPIEKKVFWGDLGVARKIYKGRALMPQAEAQAGNDQLSPSPTAGDAESGEE